MTRAKQKNEQQTSRRAVIDNFLRFEALRLMVVENKAHTSINMEQALLAGDKDAERYFLRRYAQMGTVVDILNRYYFEAQAIIWGQYEGDKLSGAGEDDHYDFHRMLKDE